MHKSKTFKMKEITKINSIFIYLTINLIFPA